MSDLLEVLESDGSTTELEPNSAEVLQRLHDAVDDDESAVATLRDWLVADQDTASVDRPMTSTVLDAVASVDAVALAISGEAGFSLFDRAADESYRQYKRIATERAREVATFENKPVSDVEITRTTVHPTDVGEWVAIALDRGRVEVVSLDDVDVFDDHSAYSRGVEA
jgi:DNA-binding PucR family transcriptional regulator